MRKWRASSWLLGAVWLAGLAATGWSLVEARRWAVAELGSPAALARYRADVEQLNQSAGPVRRRPIRSTEPPTLTLLRDHFAGVLGVCLLVVGAAWGFLLVVLQGTLRRRPDNPRVRRPPEPAAPHR